MIRTLTGKVLMKFSLIKWPWPPSKIKRKKKEVIKNLPRRILKKRLIRLPGRLPGMCPGESPVGFLACWDWGISGQKRVRGGFFENNFQRSRLLRNPYWEAGFDLS